MGVDGETARVGVDSDTWDVVRRGCVACGAIGRGGRTGVNGGGGSGWRDGVEKDDERRGGGDGGKIGKRARGDGWMVGCISVRALLMGVEGKANIGSP